MIDLLWILKGILVAGLPNTSAGRRIRIERLVKEGKGDQERDFYAAVVYMRDTERGYRLSIEEEKDWMRVATRMRRGELK